MSNILAVLTYTVDRVLDNLSIDEDGMVWAAGKFYHKLT